MITYDFEAYNWIDAYAVGIYDGTKTKILKDENITNLIEFLLNSIEDKQEAYAHFGGGYDIRFILDYLNSEDNKIYTTGKIIMIKSGFALLEVINKNTGKIIYFKDSYFLMPLSLKNLTYGLNVENKKLEMDYELGINDPNFDSYFENDLKGLYQVLIKSQMNLNKLTIASNAMEIFKNKFVTNKKLYTNKVEVDDKFRKSYYGGRTEVFKKVFNSKTETLYYYDVNSLYPTVMSGNLFPEIKYKNFTEDKTLSENGIYNVQITCNDNVNIPVLGNRDITGKLLFSTGEIEGYYCGAEIIKALSLGYSNLKIREGFIFNCVDLFSNYVKYFYDLRKSNPDLNIVYKLFLNSLYGKFGQKRTVDVLEPNNINDIGKIKQTELKDALFIADKIYTKKNVKNTRGFMHSEIAAFITSYARLYLYGLFEKAGVENIYYCDTDSIFTTTKLETSDELGGIKLEDTIIEAYFISPKFYCYKNIEGKEFVKTKGFNYKTFTFEDLKNYVLHNKPLVTKFDDFVSIKQNLKSGSKTAAITYYKKEVLNINSKRIFLDNKSSIPIKSAII